MLFDEFVMGGLAQEASSSNQQALIKMLTTIRKKRLYLILVIPYFFMLRMYFAVGRSRCLIHCYSDDGVSRGKFMFFSYVRKKDLYFYGRKFYSYKGATANFIGDFSNTNGYFYDIDEYDKKKEATIQEIASGKTKADGSPKTAHKLKRMEATYKRLMIELYLKGRYPNVAQFVKQTNWLPMSIRHAQKLINEDAVKPGFIEGLEYQCREFNEEQTKEELKKIVKENDIVDTEI